MRPAPVFPDYLVKLVISASRAILKPAVIFVSLPKSRNRGEHDGWKSAALQLFELWLSVAMKPIDHLIATN